MRSKKEIIAIVTNCAEKYKAELENKTLLFVCTDKHKRVSCYEFSFFDYNFLHLTGLRTTEIFKTRANQEIKEETIHKNIPAVRFYEKCLDHRLTESDFEVSEKGTTALKLDVLPMMICKNLSANMIGDFSSTHPRLYTEKVAGGKNAYIGFVFDEMSQRYVPNTIIKDDIRKNVTNAVRVIATYRKGKNDDKYSECVYTAAKVDWDKIKYPERFSYIPKPVMNDENAVLTAVR
ncbi:MAG: PBECR4 domain-containing protein [Oscillospiraceae bacterium]|nr:PBECR4 domain-containing protein [Oscillospiraceae bacterium]